MSNNEISNNKISNNNEMSNNEHNDNVAIFVGDETFIIEHEETVQDEPEIKRILKNGNNANNQTDFELGFKVVKCCVSVLTILTMAPISIFDIYFGFKDNACINDMPRGFHFNMKLYLLVSGFLGLVNLLIFNCLNCSITIKDRDIDRKDLCVLKSIGVINIIFNLLWNILGAVTFWSYLFKEHICTESVSTYIFISLIIKLLSNYCGINTLYARK